MCKIILINIQIITFTATIAYTLSNNLQSEQYKIIISNKIINFQIITIYKLLIHNYNNLYSHFKKNDHKIKVYNTNFFFQIS